MNRFALLACISLALPSAGGDLPENTLTPQHQSIVGTKVSIIPPAGFEHSPNFLGMQQVESGSSIVIAEIPVPYATAAREMDGKLLLSKGVEVETVDSIQLNGSSAILATGMQMSRIGMFGKVILLFGNDSQSVIVTGAYPQELESLGEQIKRSILTSVFEPRKVVDPFESMDYRIDPSETKLKFAKSFMNSLIYTIDGLVPTASPDKTSLTVTKSFSPVDVEDRKLFAINRVKQITKKVKPIRSIEPVTIDGIEGFEVLTSARSPITGEEEVVYQVILFSDGFYYIFLGTTNQHESGLEEIKKVVGSFRRI